MNQNIHLGTLDEKSLRPEPSPKRTRQASYGGEISLYKNQYIYGSV